MPGSLSFLDLLFSSLKMLLSGRLCVAVSDGRAVMDATLRAKDRRAALAFAADPFVRSGTLLRIVCPWTVSPEKIFRDHHYSRTPEVLLTARE